MKTWCVVGDMHLAKLGNLIPNHLELQYKCLDNILKEAQSMDIKDVVLLGDVFDKPNPGTDVVISLLQFLDRYSHMYFTWICGNHDRHSNNPASINIFSALASLSHVSNLDIVLTPRKKGNVSFLPYPKKIPLDGTDLAFAHVERPGATYDSGKTIPGKIGEWDETRLFIIGHIHTPQKIGKTIYTGTPYQLSFAEKPDKHWGYLETEGKGKDFSYRYKKMPIDPPYRLQRITLTEKNMEWFKEHYQDSPNTWFQVKYDMELPSNFLVNYPRCSAYIDNTIKETMQHMLESAEIAFDAMVGLESYLTSKGHDEYNVQWALEKIQKCIQNINEGKSTGE